MSVLIILLAVSITIAFGFLISFLLSVKNGQFDDLYSPSIRILFEQKNKNTNQEP